MLLCVCCVGVDVVAVDVDVVYGVVVAGVVYVARCVFGVDVDVVADVCV